MDTFDYNTSSDSWCDQGAYVTRTAVSQEIVFMKPYTVLASIRFSTQHNTLSTDGRPPLINTYNKTGFILNIYTGYAGAFWTACGTL